MLFCFVSKKVLESEDQNNGIVAIDKLPNHELDALLSAGLVVLCGMNSEIQLSVKSCV